MLETDEWPAHLDVSSVCLFCRPVPLSSTSGPVTAECRVEACLPPPVVTPFGRQTARRSSGPGGCASPLPGDPLKRLTRPPGPFGRPRDPFRSLGHQKTCSSRPDTPKTRPDTRGHARTPRTGSGDRGIGSSECPLSSDRLRMPLRYLFSPPGSVVLRSDPS